MYPFRRSILPFRIIRILQRTGEFPDTLQLLLPDQLLSRRIANERASTTLTYQRVNLIRKFLRDYDVYSSAGHNWTHLICNYDVNTEWDITGPNTYTQAVWFFRSNGLSPSALAPKSSFPEA